MLQLRKQNLDILINQKPVKILSCIIKNPYISGSSIAKKTKMPIATTYRILNSLVESGLLVTSIHNTKGKVGRKTTRYHAKAKQFQILIDINTEINIKIA